MNVPSFHERVRPAEITVLVQAAILGFLLGELWYLSQAVGSVLNGYIQCLDSPLHALIACGSIAIIGIAYCYSREGYSDLKKLGQSYRLDVLTLLVLGVCFSASVGGVGTAKYQEYVVKVHVLQLMLIAAVPVAVALMLMLRAAIFRERPDSPPPFFINDQDIKTREGDLLGLAESATRFADRVLNRGSSDSLVFGIDAPWGIGKSSFVNFCCEYWQRDPNSQIIVHRFEPLRYDDKADLADRFVNDLVNTIQKHVFVPSIRPLISKYFRLIKGSSEFSFLGLKFGLHPGPETIDDTLTNLETLLSELNRKIIIVVDDLDRLNWSAIKNILFAMKRSFMLPNVAYVLCYDTENIGLSDKISDDAEKVREFLEKFVNVKVSLFIDSSVLAKYVSTNFESAVQSNLQLDPHTLDEIKQAMEALVEIYNSKDFFRYQDLLGDIRKLKRLINTLLLLEIEKTDFENSDFNKKDLIHLLLVYVNYPSIFRKIYNTEANGKDGFFSLEVTYNADRSKKFANSLGYDEYLQTLSPNQQFLLSKLFSPDVLVSDDRKDSVEEGAMRSRACFNGQGGASRNLERYLNLIVKLSKQDKRESYQFYVRMKNKLLEGMSLDRIFEEEEFEFSRGDFSRYQLWKVIVNSTDELHPNTASQVVSHLMEHLPEYSLLDMENVAAGSRTSLTYSLLKLLDQAAWGADQSARRNNTPENISEIADWVFGERSHSGAGVLSTLAKPDRGPLGLFDLMLFRLYCSADRGGSLFNLQRALSLHGDARAPTEGNTTGIAKEGMREISQKVFQIFKNQYIAPEKNIFEAVDNLSLRDLAGKCSDFVSAQIESKKVTKDQVEQLIAAEKSRVKSFIVYQLGNSMISSGVGCGLYDETGKNDQNGIARQVNNYLFGLCFNPNVSRENFERFLDYLLTQFDHTFGLDDGVRYVPSVAVFTRVLEEERLKEYWMTHKAAIQALSLRAKKKDVRTFNYVATYEGDLDAVYRVLDQLVG